MSRLLAKAVVAVRVEPGTSLHITAPPAAVGEVPLTAGLWYILGDGTASDLLQHIQDEVQAAGGTGFRAGIDQDMGIVELAITGPNPDVTIQWFTGSGGNGSDIRDFLRLERYNAGVDITVTSAGEAGYRAGVGAYHCTNYLLEDLDEFEDVGAQLIPDDPNTPPQGIKIARRRYSNIAYQSEGFPRSTSEEFNEYHELVSFFEEAGSYRPFRVYYDRSDFDPYATDNRLGYQTYVLTKASTRQRPDPVTADYYLQMRQGFRSIAIKE